MTSAHRARKRTRARLLAFLLGLPKAEPRSPESSEVQRILIIRIDERVGNVLLTTPLFRALRRHFPDAELDLLLSASKRDLVDSLVRTVGFVKKDFFRRPWRFLRMLRDLRAARYDLAIDASHWDVFSLSSALLLGLTGARWRVAHDRGEAQLFATHLARAPSSAEHDARTKLRLLGALGLEAEDPRTETSLGKDQSPPDLTAFLSGERAHGRPLVGLLPGARKADRRAPVAVFLEIARGLEARGLRPVIIYGPGEESLAESLARPLGVPLPPPTNLSALAHLLLAMSAVVANDTGPTHLAVALGVPTLGLFLHPDLERWGYREPPHAALSLVELGAPETVRQALSMLAHAALARTH